MAVIKTKFEQSPELIAEMEFYSKTDEGQKTYARLGTPAEVVAFIENSGEYRDLQQFVRRLQAGKVLDVGVAYGVTSAYLAIHGFQVTALEPSLKLCEDMERFFGRLHLDITVVHGTGESMGEIETRFDAVVFYSSLHHCDEVKRALDNANALLRPGGRVFLFEPVLKFYRSKKWFYHMLEVDPGKVGHYGGNEHIYRFGEYVRFLKDSKFENVVSHPSLNYGHSPARAPWDSAVRYLIKKLYFSAMKNGVLKFRPLVSLLKRLSMVNVVMFANKSGRQ